MLVASLVDALTMLLLIGRSSRLGLGEYLRLEVDYRNECSFGLISMLIDIVPRTL